MFANITSRMKAEIVEKEKIEETISNKVKDYDFDKAIIAFAVEMYHFKHSFYQEEIAKGHTRECTPEEVHLFSLKHALGWIVMRFPQKFKLSEKPGFKEVDICVYELINAE